MRMVCRRESPGLLHRNARIPRADPDRLQLQPGRLTELPRFLSRISSREASQQEMPLASSTQDLESTVIQRQFLAAAAFSGAARSASDRTARDEASIRRGDETAATRIWLAVVLSSFHREAA